MSDATRQLAQFTLSVKACEKRRRKQATQQLVRGGAIACFFLCIMLLVAMLHLNRLPIREIVFEGNEHYSSAELEQIKGCKSTDIEALLGHKNFDEVIHRDDLVIL